MPRLPQPSQSDVCDACSRDRPLYRLYGSGQDHVHRCADCLRDALAGDLIAQLDQDAFVATQQTVLLLEQRNAARTWARELWVSAGVPWLRNHPEMGPPPDWLTGPPSADDDLGQQALIREWARREWDLADADWMAGARERIGSLEQELSAACAELTQAAQDRDAARASLRTAEEVVIRQKALLQAATELIEEARRWARSLWDDSPASEEPVVLNEPEVAPAWLTAGGLRHTGRRPRPQADVDPAEAEHALRLAALDRLLTDVEEEWGPITAGELDAAAQRLRERDRRR